jgi:tRNA dimethylallyltransferase
MDKLLIICGPTATGKTYWALKLAKKFKGEIISADSRQVYSGMDIGTGKELPEGVIFRRRFFESHGHYIVDGIKIWGYDLISPKKEFSVSEYYKAVAKILAGIRKRKSLPILVGGTGLYIKAIIDGMPTAGIPKNNNLRKHLVSKTISELYDILAQLDSIKAASLNSSDRKNPRRLIRAIEIAQWRVGNTTKSKKTEKKFCGMVDKRNVLVLGLKLPKSELDKKIKTRVIQRIEANVEGEIKKLLKMGVRWDMQSMNSLGYKVWQSYLEGTKTKEQITDQWTSDEKNYAKRQITWFKKDPKIIWYDVTDKKFPKNMEKLTERWYNKMTHAEKD